VGPVVTGALASRERHASFLRKPPERFCPHRHQGTANTRPLYRAGFDAAAVNLEHDPEKWIPAFGKDHAQSEN
jgi:hypothetical protein